MLYQVGSTVTKEPVSPEALIECPGIRLAGKNLWARGHKTETLLGPVFSVDGYYTTELSEPGTYCKFGRLLANGDIKLWNGQPIIITIDSLGNIVFVDGRIIGPTISRINADKTHCIPASGWVDRKWSMDFDEGLDDNNVLISIPVGTPPSEILVISMAQLSVEYTEGKLQFRCEGIIPIIDIHVLLSISKT